MPVCVEEVSPEEDQETFQYHCLQNNLNISPDDPFMEPIDFNVSAINGINKESHCSGGTNCKINDSKALPYKKPDQTESDMGRKKRKNRLAVKKCRDGMSPGGKG